MKAKIILVPLIFVVVIGGIIFAYIAMSKERALELEREKPVVAEARTKRNANGEVLLVLDDETQKRIEIKTESLVGTNVSREIKGFGRVLDPAPLVGLVADVASSEIAATGSRQEFERLKSLAENTSAKTLQAAEANAKRDEIAAQSARIHLQFAWGEAIATRKGLPEFIKSLATGERAIVRINLPVGENLPAPQHVRIVPLTTGKSVEAEFLDIAPTIDSQTQGQGFLFLAKGEKNSGLVPGASVTGFISIGELLEGVMVPRSAIVRFGGKGWIYLQTDSQTFLRRELPLDHPMDSGWFVPKEFKAGEKVVVIGAQTLLSEEQKYQIKMLD